MKRLICLLVTLVTSVGAAAEIQTLAPLLMESTFKIEGPTVDGKTAFGTCFIFLVNVPGETNGSRIVLVTANHVLNDITGESATVHLRKKAGERRMGTTPMAHRHSRQDGPLVD